MQAKGTPPEKLKLIMKERFKTGYYKPPERVGISYMLSPILRTYFNPEESGDKVPTMNIPHIMYYAPNVSNQEIGGGPLGGMYPFVIMQGPHGYIIQLMGLTERAAITKEYEEMLARLCDMKKEWCLAGDNGQY
jgi:hypothetical protein